MRWRTKNTELAKVVACDGENFNCARWLRNDTSTAEGIQHPNTSRFAIRRTHTSIPNGPFDPTALRGEATLLLARLMQDGELPLFVSNETVRQPVSLSLLKSLSKDLCSGGKEGGTFKTLDKLGVRIRMSNQDRARMLWST